MPTTPLFDKSGTESGTIDLPEMELHTTAWWLGLDPAAVAGWRREELDAALVAALFFGEGAE